MEKTSNNNEGASNTWHERSQIWVEPFSLYISHYFPMEYIFGHWYQYTKVEERKIVEMFPENLERYRPIPCGSKIEGVSIPEFWLISEENKDDFKFGEHEATFVVPDLDSMIEDNPTCEGVPIFTVEHIHDDLRYVKLKVTSEYREMKPRFKDIQYLDHLYILDSYGFVDQTTLFENYQEEIHGPALKSGPIRKDTGNFKHFNNCESDSSSVFKHPGNGWPDTCNGWFNREERKYDWPSPELIKEIQTKGCHIAPVGRERKTHMKAPTDILFMLNPREVDLEWRLSFSVAETMLGQSLPPTLRYVFVLLKILKKIYFPPDVISTYHLKQLIYWKAESRPACSWREDHCVLYVIEILDRLTECAKKRFLPHYFLPSSNTLSDTNDEQLGGVVMIVGNISTNIFEYLQNALKRMQPQWLSHLYQQDIVFSPHTLIQQIQERNNKPSATIEAMLKAFLEANIKLRKRIKPDKNKIDKIQALTNVVVLVYEIQASKTLYYLWCGKTADDGSKEGNSVMSDKNEFNEFCRSFIRQYDCKSEFEQEFDGTLDLFFTVRQSGGLMSAYEKSSLMMLLRENCYKASEEYYKGMNKKLPCIRLPNSKEIQTLLSEKDGITTKEDMTKLCNSQARDFLKSSPQPHPKLNP